MIYDIKCSPELFLQILAKREPVLVELNENYAINDLVTIREFDTRFHRYTGRTITRIITNIAQPGDTVGDIFVEPGYIAMSLAPVAHPNGEPVDK